MGSGRSVLGIETPCLNEAGKAALGESIDAWKFRH